MAKTEVQDGGVRKKGGGRKSGLAGGDGHLHGYDDHAEHPGTEEVTPEQLDSIITFFGDEVLEAVATTSRSEDKGLAAEDGESEDSEETEETSREEDDEEAEEEEPGLVKTDDPVRLYLKEMGTVPL